jgi:hypothetical protein
VTTGQDEPITSEPSWLSWIVAQNAAIEHVAEWRERHRGSLMSALGLERCVHRDPANDRDGKSVLLGTQSWQRGHGARLVARRRPQESRTDDGTYLEVVGEKDEVRA